MKELKVIDVSTGELMDNYKAVYMKQQKHHSYCLIYYHTIFKDKIIYITSGFLGIIGEMDSNNILFVDKYALEKLSKFSGISVYSLQHNLRRMLQQHIIMKVGVNAFFVNPHYFAKTNKEHVKFLRQEWASLCELKFKEKMKQKSVIIKDHKQETARLEKQLKIAIENNKFEKASKLKQKIDKL